MLAKKTAYEPLVNFTNQIYEFYKGELREHLKNEFDRWYNSEYSFQALSRNIGAGYAAVQKSQSAMDEIGAHLMLMFQRGPNKIYVDTMEPQVEDRDFETFSNAIFICVRNCEYANQNALSEINMMAMENNAVSCITGFVRSLGISMTQSFQGMIGQVEDGLGMFRVGVGTTIEQVPNVGRAVDGHIIWKKGMNFL